MSSERAVGRHIRVEKRKWDGTLSSTELALPVPADGHSFAWFVPRGTRRERPERGESELLDGDELWACVPGEWWVVCGYGRPDGSISDFDLHAATPPDVSTPGLIRWIDLDLDLELRGGRLEMADEGEFHEHALAMRYPDYVVRGAWAGISQLAPRYTTREWPFDGWLEASLHAARAGLPSAGYG